MSSCTFEVYQALNNIPLSAADSQTEPKKMNKSKFKEIIDDDTDLAGQPPAYGSEQDWNHCR